MAISKGYGEDTDSRQGWSLAAGDILTLGVQWVSGNAEATPIAIGVETDSSNTSVKIEIQITDHSSAHWYDLPGNDAITEDKPVSVDTFVYGLRITASTDGCGIELKSEGARFTRIT